ncbi:NADH dehydrogenase [ubiquinone] 1 alpha subcomplex subunit 11 [Manduca sexta]|uniref:NADH dehydrogenase [ubiquinone] 1 alpha subcomplex subunit 11 n=1 Tax=Manduca sexta TaxID=7130 RepID=UPI00188F9CFC|nr:NADH dehydrogenase [ubiquinone] 1 alpha subcomplex subunit 11 [Manduca sexta]
MSKLLNYKYYDTPEGHDIYKKTFVTSKYAFLTGLAAGSADVLMYSRPKGFVNTAGRMFYIIGPLVGMATAFTVTTNVAQNYRGKNDKLNYFMGGAAAGCVFSAWMKTGAVALPAALVLGTAAVVKKMAIDSGTEFFPTVAHATKTIKSVKHDWTITENFDELKNYTTGPN